MNVEFHFDFGSPNAYLSHRVIPAIEARTGEKFTYIPVLIGGVFNATGNASPAVTLQGVKNINDYQSIEMGAFGSPTFFVENEIFFGKDKLTDVEDEIIKNN